MLHVWLQICSTFSLSAFCKIKKENSSFKGLFFLLCVNLSKRGVSYEVTETIKGEPMSKINPKSHESQRITTEKEFHIVNAIEGGKEQYKASLGAMIEKDAPIETQKQIGDARYQFATGEISEDAWANTIGKLAPHNERVVEYCHAFSDFKNDPSDENKSILAEKDVSMMRSGNEKSYEKSLAMVASIINEKKDKGFIEFAEMWTPSFKAQEERLSETFRKGNVNVISDVVNQDMTWVKPERKEYIPYDSSLFAMEVGIEAKASVLEGGKEILKKSPKSYEKNGKMLETMAKDYSLAIGNNEVSEKALTISKGISKINNKNNSLNLSM